MLIEALGGVGQCVVATSGPGEQPAAVKALQVLMGNALGRKVARAYDPIGAHPREHPVSPGCVRLWHGFFSHDNCII